MKYITHSKAIVGLVFFLKLKMAKKNKPRSAKSRNSLVVGCASGIPKVSTKIKGIAMIMPGKKINK
jgi:hypothetical protein